MSTFSRLFDLASKALDKSSSSGRQDAARPASGDWRGIVRGAAEALTGDPRSGGAAPQHPGYASDDRGYAPDDRGHAPQNRGYAPPPAGRGNGASADAVDRAAIARYDYLMQTSDPHQVERIHHDAFARLTPAQRAEVEARMRCDLAPHERPLSASAPDLARAAARGEAMRPGRMRSMLARGARGGAIAGAGGAAVGLLGAVAGGAILSSVAGPLLEQAAGFGVDFDALAEGVDIEGLASGAEGIVGGAGEHLSGLGEQASGFGEQISNFDLPGFGDFLGR